jgi:hypothetical protein
MDRPTNPAPSLADTALALTGAVVGGGVGYVAFGWLAGQGFYALALPGVLLGLGAALPARRRAMALAVACGVLALALGVFAEWQHFPFAKDGSLGYFLTHLLDLRPLTWILIALGGFCGFWFARPATGPPRAASGETPAP